MAHELTVAFRHRYADGVVVSAELRHPLDAGRVVVLFGPSGVGKTTVLRAIAGLLRPTGGRILFGDRIWTDTAAGVFVPPQQRGIGYVAQESALFPHLTVRDNVEFGLRALPGGDRRRRAAELVDLLGLSAFADRLPREVSGGQAQRVSLARAVAARPPVLLLDEPFGALDAATRRLIREELRGLLRREGTAALLVTHDRHDAMAAGDDIAVMIGGRIRQVGPVSEVFRHPADADVARAVGVETVIDAVVRDASGGLVRVAAGRAELAAVSVDDRPLGRGDRVLACIRAEDVTVEKQTAPQPPGSARNHLHGIITRIDREGAVDRLTLDCGVEIVAAITSRSREELGFEPGTAAVAAIKATAIHLLHKA